MIYTLFNNGMNMDSTHCLEILIDRIRHSPLDYITIDSEYSSPDYVLDFIYKVFNIKLTRVMRGTVELNDFNEPAITINAALRLYKDWESYFPPNPDKDFSKEDMIKYIIKDMLEWSISSGVEISLSTRRAYMVEYLAKKEEYDNKFLDDCTSCNGIFSAIQNHFIYPGIFKELLLKYGNEENLAKLKGIVN